MTRVLPVAFFAACCSLSRAQPSADKAALLQFKGTFNESRTYSPHRRRSAINKAWMDSWTEATDPCAPGCWWHFETKTDCWEYVVCDAEYGRVTALMFYNSDNGDKTKYHLDGYDFTLGSLSTLTSLRKLDFYSVKTVTGNIASLATLTELRGLCFDDDTPGVFGNVDSLAPLTHLGERWSITSTSSTSTAPAANSNTYKGARRRTYQWCGGHKDLGSGHISLPAYVYGAMPGHPDSKLALKKDFIGQSSSMQYSGCDRWNYAPESPHTNPDAPEGVGPANVPHMKAGSNVKIATCKERGLKLIENAKGMAGFDECTCCAGSSRQRDTTTGQCSDYLIPGFPLDSELESFQCRMRNSERCTACGGGATCDACPQCAVCAGCVSTPGGGGGGGGATASGAIRATGAIVAVLVPVICA